MLGDRNAVAGLAVSDLKRARTFYEDVLGLSVESEMGDHLVTLRSGASVFNLFVSPFAGTNEATALAWEVDDVEHFVARLKAAGVVFERFDMEGATHEGDVHVFGNVRVAWFKDPDGNLLNLVKM